MRTATTVFVAGSLLVFASCSSSSNDQTDAGGYAAFGNTGTGASNTGATGASNTGATGNASTGATGNTGTGLTGTGAGGNTDCALGNACSTPSSTCVNGDVQCTCLNNVWSTCIIVSGAGGASGTGANGAGGGSTTGATGAGGGNTGDGGTGGQDTGTGGVRHGLERRQVQSTGALLRDRCDRIDA